MTSARRPLDLATPEGVLLTNVHVGDIPRSTAEQKKALTTRAAGGRVGAAQTRAFRAL
jgi:hypothetical protein